MTYDNTNKGTLWVQEEKKSEKAPDLKGSINIDGTEYPFVAWKKHTAKGTLYSLVRDKPKPKTNEPEYTQPDNDVF